MKAGTMHVGVPGIGTSKHELQFLVRHDVTHMRIIRILRR